MVVGELRSVLLTRRGDRFSGRSSCFFGGAIRIPRLERSFVAKAFAHGERLHCLRMTISVAVRTDSHNDHSTLKHKMGFTWRIEAGVMTKWGSDLNSTRRTESS